MGKENFKAVQFGISLNWSIYSSPNLEQEGRKETGRAREREEKRNGREEGERKKETLSQFHIALEREVVPTATS